MSLLSSPRFGKGKIHELIVRLMENKIIDGRSIAEGVLKEVKEEVIHLEKKGVHPRLRVILVGEDPASLSYVAGKTSTARKIGMDSETIHLPADVSEREVISIVETLNADTSVHAILVQSPMPSHISEERVFSSISPVKDVDGLHPENMGLLALGRPRVIPCTPLGIQWLLLRSGNPPEGRHVVIVGRSNLVGRPLSILLSLKSPGSNATVTLCHSLTRDLSKYTLEADILVAAVGKPHAIRSEMVPAGCVVIDVGVNRIPDPSKRSGFRLVGDVEFESLLPKVKGITPVPGGVGPMTVAMLMKNVITLCKMQTKT